MEGYLRIALLSLAAIVVFLAVFEFGFRRRKHKSARLSNRADLGELIDLDPHSVSYNSQEPIFVNGNDDSCLEENEIFATNTRTANAAPHSYQTQYTPPQSLRVKSPQPAPNESQAGTLAQDLLVLMVIAKPGQQFVSYELLQAIYSAGLQFGEMNIFHFYQMTFKGRAALFSLASATEPGDFNLDKMGNYACNGLTLFANLKQVQDPQYVFDLMIKTAEQLADDLDGELRAGPRILWNDNIKKQYQQKVSQYLVTTFA